MCQMPNIWHIWHTKYKNGVLLDVLNFCNMLQYRCIFDIVRTQMAFVLYYFFIHLSLSSHFKPLHLHFSGSYSLPPSLSNRPLSNEGWVPMWVYSGVGSGVGQVTMWVVGMAAWWVAVSWVVARWVTARWVTDSQQR